MRNKLTIVAILLLMSVLPYSTVLAKGNMVASIHELINQYRKKKGLPPVQMYSTISSQAEKHSRNMASGRVPFGHSGFDNRLDGLMHSIKGSNAGAENVAYGAETAEEVVRMWINSKGHRKNILGNYNLTGIGVVKGRDGNLYYTQIFIRRK